MSNCTRYLGLDVHAETITAAIAEGRGKIRSLGKFANRPEAVRKLIEKLDGGKNLKVCYEAGPTGYALYWQLTKLGVDCEVIAPSLIPKKASDKVKTDRRDAEKLAQSYQSGDLTPVWVPRFPSDTRIELLTRKCNNAPESHKPCTVAVETRSRAATSRTVKKGPMVETSDPTPPACTTIAPNDRLFGTFFGDARLRSSFVTC